MPNHNTPGGYPARGDDARAERMHITLVNIPPTRGDDAGVRVVIRYRGRDLATYHAFGTSDVRSVEVPDNQILHTLSMAARGRDPWPAFVRHYGATDDGDTGHKILADIASLAVRGWVRLESFGNWTTVEMSDRAHSVNRMALMVVSGTMPHQAIGGDT